MRGQHQHVSHRKTTAELGSGGHTLVDALYTRFVARDFLAKIVPGSLPLIAASFVWGKDVLDYLRMMSAWEWVVAGGISWLFAFAIEALGEWVRWSRPAPRQVLPQRYHIAYQLFQIQETCPRTRHLAERFHVLREATAIASMSCILCGAVFILGAVLPLWPATLATIHGQQSVRISPLPINWHDFWLGIVCFPVAFGLRRMHMEYRRRHWQIIRGVARDENNRTLLDEVEARKNVESRSERISGGARTN